MLNRKKNDKNIEAQEISQCFESMLLPNRYMYKDLHLVPSTPEAQTDKRDSLLDFSTFGTLSNWSNTDSSARNSSSWREESDSEDLVVRHKFRSWSFDLPKGGSNKKSYISPFDDSISHSIKLEANSGNEKFGYSPKRELKYEFAMDEGWKSPTKRSTDVSQILPFGLSLDSDHSDSECSSIEGRVVSYSQTQKGCRFLQRLLSDGNPQNYKTIFDELYSSFVDLMIGL